MEFDGGLWTVLGDADEVKQSEQRIVRFTAGVILIGGLLDFIEETIDVLFAAWRKTMQACQRQFFLEFGAAVAS